MAVCSTDHMVTCNCNTEWPHTDSSAEHACSTGSGNSGCSTDEGAGSCNSWADNSWADGFCIGFEISLAMQP